MKLSLFSVGYAGYWGQQMLALPDFVAKAGSLGYESVMLAAKRPHLSPLDVDDEALLTLRETMGRHSVTCSAIGGYTDFSPLTAAEVPYFEMQIHYVESLARMASKLGANIVRVFTAYDVNENSPYVIWNGVVQSLQEICDRAAPYGVTIAVQNHHDVAVHTTALLELLSDVDRANCRLGFDAWSPALRGEDLYEAARMAAPYTVMTTNADYIRLPRHRLNASCINYTKAEPDLVRAVKFGEGFIDYQAFFHGLLDGGFTGVANYEMCSRIRGGGSPENLDRFSSQYVLWMREHFTDR